MGGLRRFPNELQYMYDEVLGTFVGSLGKMSKAIANFIEDMYQNGEIDDYTKDYLLSCPGRTSELYLLPKIHKPSFGQGNMPSRPIMSANGSPTEKISEFVDFFLNPTTFDLPAYVRDTTDFLRKLKQIGPLPKGTLLVTLDVESLYTNIPNDFGIRAARITLLEKRNTPGIKPTNESLLKLLRLVLTSNNFSFNGSNFLQVGSCTMGSKVSVGYANNRTLRRTTCIHIPGPTTHILEVH